jgi:hypothetical protein
MSKSNYLPGNEKLSFTKSSYKQVAPKEASYATFASFLQTGRRYAAILNKIRKGNFVVHTFETTS